MKVIYHLQSQLHKGLILYLNFVSYDDIHQMALHLGKEIAQSVANVYKWIYFLLQFKHN